jgi:hypothetical protein
MKINQRRLALSLGIVGAVLLPISTGNLKKLSSKPSIFTKVYETDTVEEKKALKFYADNNFDEIDCVYVLGRDNRNKHTKELCDEVDKFKTIKTSIGGVTDEFVQFMLVSLLGFLIPSLIVLLGPRLVMSYVNWLTR